MDIPAWMDMPALTYCTDLLRECALLIHIVPVLHRFAAHSFGQVCFCIVAGDEPSTSTQRKGRLLEGRLHKQLLPSRTRPKEATTTEPSDKAPEGEEAASE